MAELKSMGDLKPRNKIARNTAFDKPIEVQIEEREYVRPRGRPPKKREEAEYERLKALGKMPDDYQPLTLYERRLRKTYNQADIEAYVEEICFHLAEGKSLSSYCNEPNAPCLRVVMKWQLDNPEIRNRFKMAREMSSDVWMDKHAEVLQEVLTEKVAIDKARVYLPEAMARAKTLSPGNYNATKVMHADNNGGGLSINHILSSIDGTSRGLPKD